MRIAILRTGQATPTTRERQGDYDELFRRSLAEPGQQWDTFDVEHDEFPPHPAAFDALVVTGSRHSVTDDQPWIHRLLDLLRQAHRLRRRMLGVCFGHQAMAAALGGAAAANPQGWELGLKHVFLTEATAAYPGLAEAPNPLRLFQTHQDVVTALPPEAEHLAFSERTRYEMFAVGDTVLCIQGHPEFDEAVMRDLLERWGERFPPDRVAEGLASLTRPPHSEFVRQWVRGFLRGEPLRATAPHTMPGA